MRPTDPHSSRAADSHASFSNAVVPSRQDCPAATGSSSQKTHSRQRDGSWSSVSSVSGTRFRPVTGPSCPAAARRTVARPSSPALPVPLLGLVPTVGRSYVPAAASRKGSHRDRRGLDGGSAGRTRLVWRTITGVVAIHRVDRVALHAGAEAH